ncbi:hypothetical protein LDENG_00043750 [Lucifuga dentata]|nr:hypothetical protein LDENG_00043750 [Lucifuga dentata]
MMVSKGLSCEAPSSPQCFRRNSKEDIYTCEWSMNATESDMKYDVYFNGKIQPPSRNSIFKETKSGSVWTRYQFLEEQLSIYWPVSIWVKARTGNSSCTSPKINVTLSNLVKYEAPQNISVSWEKNSLVLSWIAAEKQKASAEVRFQRQEDPTESWENRSTSTNITDTIYKVIIRNLQKHSSYRVQVRHQSTQAPTPLWSDWSPVVTVPAELEHQLEVNVIKMLQNGNRKLTLTWKPVSPAAAVGVTYNVTDTQSSHGCPCQTRTHHISTTMTNYTTYVTYSAVNISVIAMNTAGRSPPAVVLVQAEPAADLKPCDQMLREEKLHKTTCLEWYEFQDGDLRPESVITLRARMSKQKKKKMRNQIQEYVRYLYFEHRCISGRPQTVKMCLYYKKEGAPSSEPEDFNALSETHSSANLSWKAIPLEDQRGFLTHYIMCSMKINLQSEAKDCRNISASLVKYHLENLTPGAKYNISLAGATRMGKGPEATVLINTVPEKPVNVWLSFGLLFAMSLISIVCTIILKRAKNRIFPPMPTPVIPDSANYQRENQEMLPGKEEVHEFTLHQLHPEGKSVEMSEDQEETTFLHGALRNDDATDEDTENEKSDGSQDECLTLSYKEKAVRDTDIDMTDLGQADDEIAMLIYRNGLVFDVKTDSP